MHMHTDSYLGNNDWAEFTTALQRLCRRQLLAQNVDPAPLREAIVKLFSEQDVSHCAYVHLLSMLQDLDEDLWASYLVYLASGDYPVFRDALIARGARWVETLPAEVRPLVDLLDHLAHDQVGLADKRTGANTRTRTHTLMFTSGDWEGRLRLFGAASAARPPVSAGRLLRFPGEPRGRGHVGFLLPPRCPPRAPREPASAWPWLLVANDLYTTVLAGSIVGATCTYITTRYRLHTIFNSTSVFY